MNLNDEQRLYLSLVLEHFRAAGDWPILKDVQREIVRRIGRSVDILEVVGDLPSDARPFSFHLHNPAILNIQALTLSAEADAELSDFLSFLRLAVERYFGREESPSISSAELAERFGMNELRLKKLHALLKVEPLIVGSGSSSESPFAWEYEVSDTAHKFADVETIEDYLEIRNRMLSLRSAPEVSSGTLAEEPGPPVSTMDMDQLHPQVVDAAGRLFEDGYYAQAIFEAFKAVEVRVRAQSGLEMSGRDLMAHAFSGEPLRIRIAREAGRSGEDEQEGFKFLFMGAMQGIRNPKGHGFVQQESPGRALEYLAFASLLMHRLDDAVTDDFDDERA